MKPEHKKIIGDLIDIFDDYEALNAKTATQRNVEACCDYNKHIFYRLCDIAKTEIFSCIFYNWYLDNYKTYENLVAAAMKGEDDFLRDKFTKIVKLSDISLTDIIVIFENELRDYFKNKQQEENEND